MKIIKRQDLPQFYEQMMATETHHNHEIVLECGMLRWKKDDFVRRLIDACNLNHIVGELQAKGNGRNSEIYRELYRKMGYSLDGYWEVFYWEMNNEDCMDYVQPIPRDVCR